MGWKFKCSLCGHKFSGKPSGDAHIALHISNGKAAHLIPRETVEPDYSDAEYELHRRYGI